MNTDFLNYASKQIADERLNECYKNDIALWAKDKLGYHLWKKQIEIAEALVKYKRVAVKSGHGVGKSFVASIIIAWWVDTRQHTDSVAVSSAPVQNQLGIVWEYLRDHHRKADLFGRITLDNEWKSDSDVLRGMGRKPSNTNEHAFQGIHRRNGVLAVLDEGCGIPETIFTSVDAITTGRYDAALCVGNPDDINTPFGAIWRNNDPSWHKITISSWDSPNLTGEDFPEEARGGLVTREWIESRKIAWGEDSPRYKSKVLGEFSEDSSSSLFSLGTLARASNTELEIQQESTPVLGVDVARMGEDYSVVYSYQDGVLRFVDKWSKATAMETAQRIVNWAWELGAKEVRIDGVGLGGPVIDIVNSKSDARFVTVSMLGNGATPDPDKWFNARAYWYDDLRERMFNNHIDMDGEDADLKAELEDLRYHFDNPRNSLQIEKKQEIKRRTGKSPDFADAAAYACATIGIDPSSPEAKLKIGETYQMDMNDLLESWETSISPF